MNLNSEKHKKNRQIHHKNSHNTASDKEVHPSYATSPSPASNVLALYNYAQNGDYIHLQCSMASKPVPLASELSKILV